MVCGPVTGLSSYNNTKRMRTDDTAADEHFKVTTVARDAACQVQWEPSRTRKPYLLLTESPRVEVKTSKQQIHLLCN